MTMVGSLVFFIAHACYEGPYAWRVNYVFGLFVFAAVLISRISIEEGFDRAVIYGFFLAIVVWGVSNFFLFLPEPFRPLSFIVNGIFIAGIWFLASRLTWDCTVNDHSRDVSASGLVELFRRKVKRGTELVMPTESESGSELGESVVSVQDSATQIAQPDTSNLTWDKKIFNLWPFRRKKKNTPGMWILYFSLVAIPLFGLGQLLIPSTNVGGRRYAFFLFAAYLLSALGLLMMTSLISLQRYLKRRRAVMPDSISQTWMIFGTILALMVLGTVWLLPRPAPEHSVTQLMPRLLDAGPKSLSSWGWGNEGPQNRDNATRTQKNEKAEKTSSGRNSKKQGGSQKGNKQSQSKETSQQKQSRSKSKNQKSGPKSKSKGKDSSPKGRGKGGSSQGKSKGPKDAKSAKSLGDKKGNQKSQSKPKGNSPKKNSQQGDSKESKNKGSESNPKNNSKQSRNPKAKGDSRKENQAKSAEQDGKRRNDAQPSGRKSSQRRQSKPNSNRSQNPRKSSRPQSNRSQSNASRSPSQFSAPSTAGCASVIKWISIAIILLVIVGLAIYFRKELLASVRNFIQGIKDFFANWFGNRSRDPASAAAAAREKTKPVRLFSSFQNPFRSGKAGKMTADQLVEQTYEAFQAWGNQHGCPPAQDQTPFEYCRILGQRQRGIPRSQTEQFATIVGQQLYSNTSIDQQQLAILQQLWSAMESNPPRPMSNAEPDLAMGN